MITIILTVLLFIVLVFFAYYVIKDTKVVKKPILVKPESKENMIQGSELFCNIYNCITMHCKWTIDNDGRIDSMKELIDDIHEIICG